MLCRGEKKLDRGVGDRRSCTDERAAPTRPVARTRATEAAVPHEAEALKSLLSRSSSELVSRGTKSQSPKSKSRAVVTTRSFARLRSGKVPRLPLGPCHRLCRHAGRAPAASWHLLPGPSVKRIGRQETRLPLALASVTLGSGANLRGTAAGACRRVRGPAGGHAFRARPTSRRSLRESDAQGPWERTAVALILSVSPFPSSCC